MQKWQEIKEIYSKRLTNQNAEDLIARRIWEGLDLPGSIKNIYQIEKQLYFDTFEDEPLFDRMLSIFKYFYNKNVGSFKFHCETLEIKDHNDITDRASAVLDFARQASEIPLFFTRLKNTDKSLVYAVEFKSEFVNRYKPPYHVLPVEDVTYNGSAVIIVMNTVNFVRQYGPYNDVKYLYAGKTND